MPHDDFVILQNHGTQLGAPLTINPGERAYQPSVLFDLYN